MNILMVGLFTNNVFDGDETIAHGFEELGHHVTKINYRQTKWINFKLPKIATNFDILIIGKGDSIWPLTLKQINIPKVFWYGDQRKDVQSWVVNRAKHCDLFLHTTSGERLEAYHREIKRPSAFFMVPCQPSLYDSFSDYKNEIFFSGSPSSNLGDPLRTDVLAELSTYSNFKWAGNTPETVIKGKEYGNEISRSKISISINHFNQFYKYNSDRIIHYSCGGFVLAYNIPGISELFQHIPTFNSIPSLREKVRYFLKNDQERETLRTLIMEETREKYNAKTMCTYILDCLSTGQSPIYPNFEYYNTK